MCGAVPFVLNRHVQPSLVQWIYSLASMCYGHDNVLATVITFLILHVCQEEN